MSDLRRFIAECAVSDLQRVIAEYAASAPLMLEPAVARDRCIDQSRAFARLCARYGIDAEVVSGLRTHLVGRVRVVECGHFAVRVGEQVVDWTYRQFDPTCEVPKVSSYESWRAEWPSV